MPRLDNLEELRVFVQVVESGSLTAAGRVLGLPANTVGRRIASLEERIGKPVLYRSTRSLSLSDSGRVLLARARRIIDEVDAAVLDLEDESEELAGTVKITVMSALAEEFLAAIRPLLRDHPSFRVQLRVHDRPRSPVEDGVDVVITGGHKPDSNLVARKLMMAKVVLAASKSYLKEMGEPCSPEELENHRALPLISEPPRSTWVLRSRRGKSITVPIDARVEIDESRTMLDAMIAGLGIGVTSTRAIARHQELRQVLPGYSLGEFPLYAVYPSTGNRSRRLKLVVDELARRLAKVA